MSHHHEAPIVTSTGEAGVSRRTYDRVAVNPREFSEDTDQLIADAERLTSMVDRERSVGRAVFKGLVRNEARDQLMRSALRDSVEVSLPADEFGQAGSSLMYIAKNKPDRQAIHPVPEMVATTAPPEKAPRPVASRIDAVREQGFEFTDRLLSDTDREQLTELWGQTFRWTREGVDTLSKRLDDERARPPHERELWLSVTKDETGITSAAMAERLQVPGPNGSLDMIESTEWATRQDQSNRGLMSATVANLNAQILRDLHPDDSIAPPLIYAECNYTTRADAVGYAVGMRIPDRPEDGSAPAQTLVQNVAVNDHAPGLPQDSLRDFSFMYLPYSSIEQDYADPAALTTLTEEY